MVTTSISATGNNAERSDDVDILLMMSADATRYSWLPLHSHVPPNVSHGWGVKSSQSGSFEESSRGENIVGESSRMNGTLSGSAAVSPSSILFTKVSCGVNLSSSSLLICTIPTCKR